MKRASILVPFLLLFTVLRAEKVFTIQEAMQTALKKNLDIRKAYNQFWYAKNDLRDDNSEKLPQVSLDHSYTREEYIGGDSTTRDTSYYRGSMTVSQELFRMGKDSYSPELSLVQAETDYEQTTLDQITRLRKAFIEYLLIKDEIDLRLRLADEFKLRYERIQARLDAGKVLPIEVKEARLEFLDEQLRVNSLKRSLRNKKLELLVRIGTGKEILPDEVEFTGRISDFLKEAVWEKDRAHFIEAGLKQRVELVNAREAARLQARVVFGTYFQWLPSVSGDVAQYTVNGQTLKLNVENSSDLWRTLFKYSYPLWEKPASDDGTDNWSLKLNVSLPLFSGFKKWARLNKERASLQDLEYDLELEKNDIRLEVSNAYFAMQNLREREDIEKERVQTTKERMTIIEELIELPLKTYITYDDVLSRREAFTYAQQNYFSVRKAFLFAIEDLNKAAGIRTWDTGAE